MYRTMNLFNAHPEKGQKELRKLHTLFAQADLRSSDYLEGRGHAR